MDNIYTNELNPNEIVIIDRSEASKKSILMKHITTCIEAIKSQTGFYKINLSVDVQYDVGKYSVSANEDSYQISSDLDKKLHILDINEKHSPRVLETTTLMVGQRYKLALSSDYNHIVYKQLNGGNTTDDCSTSSLHDTWYKHTLDTITPIKEGIYTLEVVVNGIKYNKKFVIVPQPSFVADVNYMEYTKSSNDDITVFTER